MPLLSLLQRSTKSDDFMDTQPRFQLHHHGNDATAHTMDLKDIARCIAQYYFYHEISVNIFQVLASTKTLL